MHKFLICFSYLSCLLLVENWLLLPAVTCALVLLISFAVQPTLAKRISKYERELSTSGTGS